MLTFWKSCQGKTSLGADISWLSQFAGEREMLFPPRTHLQIVGAHSQKVLSVVTLQRCMH